jgi:hypothetical protein
VSYDGSIYADVDFLDSSDKGFDLQRVPVDVVRFVRIADTGSGGIVIDAVEAL